MRIWIDLANSPQVPFFVPIIREFERGGHEAVITTRDFAQTVQLAGSYRLTHTTIGQHGGPSWVSNLQANFARAWELACWARQQQRFDLAVSHNSYSQALAARLLGLPFVTLMDYEHQPLNHLCFRLARRVIVPEAFPDKCLDRFGAARRAVKYRGVKEQLYLTGFCSSPSFLRDQGIPEDKIVIVIRPPAPWAAYHHFENPIFDQVLTILGHHPDTFIVLLARIPAQGEEVRSLGLRNVWVPPKALDGPNLLYHADLVISGGGTMNREAALLGTPTYTVFAGKLGAVDRYLMQHGRMVHVATAEDIGQIRIEKRRAHAPFFGDGSLVQDVTRLILKGAP